MRIGVEASTLGEKSTGTSRFLICLLEQLGNTSHEITKFEPRTHHRINNHVINSIRRNWYRSFGIKNDTDFSRIDCMIFPNYYMPNHIGKRSAIVIHDLSFISHPEFYSRNFVYYYKYQLKQTLKQKPEIVTISEHSRNNICKYLGIKKEDVHLLQAYSKFHSMDQATIKVTKNGDPPYLLFVGHLEPRKNLDFLIDGFLKWKSSRKNNFKLKIAGELWIKSPSIISLLNNYKNHPDIEFTGYVTENELQKIYSTAAGFVHTSFEEGFGFPVLEAMHFGLPILCTKNIATEEISKPCSITVSPIDTENYIEGLDKLNEIIQDKNKIKYDIKYSPELMKKQLDLLLDKLSSKGKKYHKVKIPPANTPEQAIEKTLVYSDLFNSGISKDKLHKQIFDKSINHDELQKIIEKLSKLNLISFADGVFKLKKRVNGFYKKAKKKIDNKKIRRIVGFLTILPFISMISLSGGTTHYGIENHDDIDLFIITKPYTVYIVYFMIHIFSVFYNVRDILCVNYLVDETNLAIGHTHDPYTAHQIISLTPLKNERMLHHFWKVNNWVKDYFPNFNFNDGLIDKPAKIYFLFKPLNGLLMLFYRSIYRNKIKEMEPEGSIKLTQRCIKLHTNDHRDKIMNEFKTAWEKYSNSYKLT